MLNTTHVIELNQLLTSDVELHTIISGEGRKVSNSQTGHQSKYTP